MSTSIDQRIVEMRFDNKQFEDGAQTSLSTIEKLKNSLDIFKAGDAFKGFGDLDTSGLDKFGNATDSVKDKFSVLEKIATGALLNIGSKIADVTMGLLNQVNPLNHVNEGWDKYAEKTTSVQTIMAATRDSWEESARALGFEGSQMEFVDEQLEKLNWFTDETSYGFTDMVSNIGKFTSNGVALQDAVTSMEGIATWAGLSGANVQDASRAMYNFSQAMGAGAMKLQDWKSIENANMATTEFKRTAIETAIELGRLKDNGDGTYIAAKKWAKLDPETFTIESFSTQLSSLWFNKDVMEATLKKFGGFTDELNKFYGTVEDHYPTTSKLLDDLDKYQELAGDDAKQTEFLKDIADDTGVSIEELKKEFTLLNSEGMELGKRAFRASQEAKTFQEAIDSVKDAASTSWMNIFESIFGNYEEAKELWTDLANSLWDIFVGPVSNVADMMAVWKEAGGRDDLFAGFKALGNTLEPVIEALTAGLGEFDADVFGEKLADLTKRFKEWAESIEVPQRLLDILSGISERFFIILGKGGDAIKGIVGKFIDFGKAIAEYISKSERAKDLFNAIIDAFANIERRLGLTFNGFTSTMNVFHRFSKQLKETEGFKAFIDMIDRAKNTIEELGGILVDKLIGIFQKIAGVKGFVDIDPLVNGVSKFLSMVSTIGNGFLDIVDRLIEGIKAFFGVFKTVDTSGLDEVSDKVETKLSPLQMLLEGLKKVLGGAVEFFKAVAPVISAVFGAIGEGLRKMGSNLSLSIKEGDYSTIMDFINSGALIGIAAAVSGFIKKLTNTDFSGGLVGSLKDIFGTIKDGIEGLFGGGSDNIPDLMIKMAAAIGILAASVTVLSMIDADKLSMALLAVSALMAELTTFTKQLDGTKVKGVAVSMLAFSASILILAEAMKSVAELSWEEVLKGLTAIGLLCAMLVKVSDTLSKQEKKMKVGAISLIAFAGAINLLAIPVKDLGQLNIEDLIAGLGAVAILCVEIGVFMKAMDSVQVGVGSGLALIEISAALLIMGEAVKKLGELPVEQATQGIYAMAAILTAIAGFQIVTSGSSEIMTTSVAILGMAAAMVVFGKAMEILGGLSLEEIGKALGALGIALLMIVPAVKKMNEALIGAEAMIVVSGAIILLAGGLAALGNIPVLELIKALVALAAALAIFGAAAILLAPVAPVMMSIAASIAVFGAAILAIGTGVFLLVSAFTALGQVTKVVDTLTTSLERIGKHGSFAAGIKLIGVALMELIKIIPNLVITTIKSLTDILDAFIPFGQKLIFVIKELLPPIIEAVVACFAQIIRSTAEHGPEIIENAIRILMLLLVELRSHLQEVVALVLDTILELIKGITAKVPMFIDAGIDLVVGLIDGLATGIDQSRERISAAIQHLFESLILVAMDVLGIHSPSTVFRDIAINLVLGAIEGLTSKAADIVNAVIEMVKGMIDAAKNKASEFIQVGIDAAKGFIDGLKSKVSDAVTAARNLASEAWNGVKNFLDINSPSKKMAMLGENATLGLAEGMVDNLSVMTGAGTQVAQASFDAIKDAMSKADMLLEETVNPTISPVLDLSEVESGASTLNRMLNSSYSTSIGSSFSNVKPSSPYSQLAGALTGIQGGDSISYGNISVNVYAAPGQNANDIADVALSKLNRQIKRQRAAFS